MKPRPKTRKPRAARSTTRASDAVAAAAERAGAKPVSANKLAVLKKKVAEARDLELEIKSRTEQTIALQKKLNNILYDELPSMFEEYGLRDMTLEAEGNVPAFSAKLKTQIEASLPKDEKRRTQAFKKFKWLGELAKNTFTVALGREDAKKAKQLEVALKKLRTSFDRKVSVHSGTLTAEIRRRYDDGHPLAPADLELLGAFVRPIVKIDQVKEKK